MSSKLFAGSMIVPAATFGAAAICAFAAVTQQATIAIIIHPAIFRIAIVNLLNVFEQTPQA
jgi:hypothetical protein